MEGGMGLGGAGGAGMSRDADPEKPETASGRTSLEQSMCIVKDLAHRGWLRGELCLPMYGKSPDGLFSSTIV